MRDGFADGAGTQSPPEKPVKAMYHACNQPRLLAMNFQAKYDEGTAIDASSGRVARALYAEAAFLSILMANCGMLKVNPLSSQF